ncbi:class I tRNA ligase family protein, partial [candidate division WOR-3 bacterium]|nr:class I tRNA ligase family protein [candidate division WOR-3 bacterium]
KCHERGLVREGTDVMPWCARCGTAISDQEIVTEGYRELTHKAVFLRFPLEDRPGEHLLVWTTTPWTLTSNTAAAVHPTLFYVRARRDGVVYVLARDLLRVLGPGAEVIEELPGAKLAGLRYRGPFDELGPQQGVEHRVITWDEVSAADGTGVVHIAPGCGKEDFLLGREHGLAVVAPLNEDGSFRPEFGWLAGRDSAEVAGDIFKDLERKGLLWRVEDYTHRYPVCWRCGQELVFRLVDEWFISMDPLREEIMESARQVRWIPAFGLERELDWLRNMSDWCISKKRYWGLALPIYRCECGWFDVVGSRDELRARAVAGWQEFDGHTPHRPWVDAVRIGCGSCGRPAQRIRDVGNPWLDAGIVPFSTTGYLTDRDHWQQWFPFDFITESFPGQFRNWFYAILAMSTVLERRSPFRTVLGYATMRAEDGREMHKSWGNAIEVDEAVEKMGADVMRWVFTSQNPAQNLHFGYQAGREAERKLLTLWNVYSFFVTYAGIDGWTPGSFDPAAPRSPSLLDRWIVSRLNSLVRLTHERLDDFDPAAVPRAVEEFVDDLSVWYVRRSRRRFWRPASDSDKSSAYHTLYTCLTTLTRVLAPFMPFIAEDIYQNLVRGVDSAAPDSVHLCPYPEVAAADIDPQLEAEVGLVRSLVSLGRAAREKAKLKVRQPLAAAIFRTATPEERQVVLRHGDAVREELNVRALLFADAPATGSPAAPGADFPPDYVVEEAGEYAAGVCTLLTPELEHEGLARELVHKVQNLRKEAGFEVTDRIILQITGSPKLAEAVQAFRDYLASETLALDVRGETKTAGSPAAPGTSETATDHDIAADVRVNRETARLALKKVRT